MTSLQIDPSSFALVLIDLQRGILARDTSPHSSADVLAVCVRLAERVRKAGGQVVLVHVGYSDDGMDRLTPPADQATAGGPMPPGFSELASELGPVPGDLVIMKRQWGAFYGTELELQLRRRGLTTIGLAGISTNFGVESTGRDAWERGFEVIFIEDAMAGLTSGAHQFAVTTIFPRLGRVRSSIDVLAALGHGED